MPRRSFGGNTPDDTAYHEQRRMEEIAREYGEAEARAYAKANGISRKSGKRVRTAKSGNRER